MEISILPGRPSDDGDGDDDEKFSSTAPRTNVYGCDTCQSCNQPLNVQIMENVKLESKVPVFVSSLKYFSAVALAGMIENVGFPVTDLPLSMENSRYHKFHILEKLCRGNKTMMMQIGIHSSGILLHSFLDEIGGLKSIMGEHGFAPEVVQEYLTKVQEQTDNDEKSEILSIHSQVSQFLIDGFKNHLKDYVGQMRRFFLDAADKWEEYEIVYFRMGFADFHFPEFLNASMMVMMEKTLTLAAMPPSASMAYHMTHDLLIRYEDRHPIGYDYYVAKFTLKVLAFSGKFVPAISREDQTMFLVPEKLVDFSVDPDPLCECVRRDNESHSLVCRSKTEMFFFKLMKRIVHAELYFLSKRSAFYCLKSALYFNAYHETYQWRKVTRSYPVDIYCHLAISLCHAGLSIDAVFFCLENAFYKSQDLAGQIQCMTTTHKIMVMMKAFRRANFFFNAEILKLHLPFSNHYFFKSALTHLYSRLDFLINWVLSCQINNLYHKNCIPGPCFSKGKKRRSLVEYDIGPAENDDQDSSDSDDSSTYDSSRDTYPHSCYRGFRMAQKSFAYWNLDIKLEEEIGIFEQQIDRLSKVAAQNHGMLDVKYLSIMHSMLYCASVQSKNSFGIYMANIRDVKEKLDQCFHLLDLNRVHCRCRDHTEVYEPFYCRCVQESPLLVLKFGLWKTMIRTGMFSRELESLDYFITLTTLTIIGAKSLFHGECYEILENVFVTQILMLLIMHRPNTTSFVRVLLQFIEQIHELMSESGKEEHYRKILTDEIKLVYLDGLRHFQTRDEFISELSRNQEGAEPVTLKCCEKKTKQVFENEENCTKFRDWLNTLQSKIELQREESGFIGTKSFMQTLVTKWPQTKELFTDGYLCAAENDE